MSDNNQTPDYQEILDKYAADLQTPPKIIPDIPEVPETLETPETLIPESIPAPEPELAISEPIIPPETIVPPEPIISPETINKVEAVPEIIPTVSPELPPTPPMPEFTPEPQFESTLPPEINPEAPKKENNFFKYLFFISLIIFLGVLIAVVLSFINSQKSQPSSTATPTSSISPTSAPGSVCEINDQKYAIDETFTADDGCNTCTCNSDLTIACTEKTCDITPTKSAIKPQPTKISEKINKNFMCGTYSAERDNNTYPPRPAFGQAPLLVKLSGSAGVDSSTSLAGIQWDYEGNGNWDSKITESRSNYIYLKDGKYTPKFRAKGINGFFGPTCTYPYEIIVDSTKTPAFQNDIIAVDKINLEYTISKSKQNYQFTGAESVLNDRSVDIYVPGFSVSARKSFTAIRFKNTYDHTIGIYEVGNDLNEGTSASYHLFIDKNKPNGVYEVKNQLTYTTSNGTVTTDGPIISYKITVTD